MPKYISEIIGTFVLVLFGTGAAVCGAALNLGVLGVAFAFGLSIVAMAYTIGKISGCHINPAVSFAMWINKRMSFAEFCGYIISQVIGALLGSLALFTILKIGGFGTDALGQNAFNSFGAGGAFLIETILTFVFVLVVIATTSKKSNVGNLAGLFIGLTLVLVHILGIPLTGTSVNPARSLAPAIFVGGEAIKQVWVFILAPLVGGAIAAFVGKYLLNTEEEE
ncbi:MAG: aquaporin [Firmicutes bacterium]|nr:aquaporin [Bacillota bacterium]